MKLDASGGTIKSPKTYNKSVMANKFGKYTAKQIIAMASVLTILLLVCLAIVFTSKNTNGAKSVPLSKAKTGQSYWFFVNRQDSKAYIYNQNENTLMPYLKLNQGEDIQISNSGEMLAKTHSNIVEIANSNINPNFRKLYESPNTSDNVSVKWLPDNSGMLLVTSKIEDVDSDEPADLETTYSHDIFYINKDGTGLKKIFEYPESEGKIEIDSIDLARNEIYLGEIGEGGGRIAAATYDLTNGSLISKSDSGESAPIANGKVYKISSSAETGAAIISETNLDTGKNKVAYSAKNQNTTVNNNSQVTTGFGNLTVSADAKNIYFSEVQLAQKPNTELKQIDTLNGNTKTIYSPSPSDNQIAVETQASRADEVVALSWCADCIHGTKNNSFTYLYISPVSKPKTIYTAKNGPVLKSFQKIKII